VEGLVSIMFWVEIYGGVTSRQSIIGFFGRLFPVALTLSPDSFGGQWSLVASLGFYNYQHYPVLQALKLQERLKLYQISERVGIEKWRG